ncbi:hypothetical protein LTS17_006346 [Exophiala oligosperma]
MEPFHQVLVSPDDSPRPASDQLPLTMESPSSKTDDWLSGVGTRESLDTVMVNRDGIMPESDFPNFNEAFLSSEGEDSFVQDSASPLIEDLSENSWDSIVSELVYDLVQEFVTDAKAHLTCRPQGSDQSSSHSGATALNTLTGYEASSATSYSSCSLSRTKSRQIEDEDPEDKKRGPKRMRCDENDPGVASTEKLLACPYAKNDPFRYSERNTNPTEMVYHKCASKILTNIPRLKQHLYRVHKRPDHYCSSCFQEFDSEQNRSHHERERSCLIVDCPFEEKMDPDQCKAVKRRKTLFPGARLPDDPYVECTETLLARRIVSEFTAFAEQEAPTRLAERMAIPLFGAGYELELQWRLNQVLEESLPLVLSELRQQFSILNKAQAGTTVRPRIADSER